MVTCIAYFGLGLTTPDLERVVIEWPVSLDTLAGKDCELTNTCSCDCSVGPKEWLDGNGIGGGDVRSGEEEICGVMEVSREDWALWVLGVVGHTGTVVVKGKVNNNWGKRLLPCDATLSGGDVSPLKGKKSSLNRTWRDK
ncbi:hypothetical protein FF1_007112 [Malus domestica]